MPAYSGLSRTSARGRRTGGPQNPENRCGHGIRAGPLQTRAKNAELKRINRLFVGRELRMVELKERIRKLEQHDRLQGEKDTGSVV
jgi:hypothetical protein